MACFYAWAKKQANEALEEIYGTSDPEVIASYWTKKDNSTEIIDITELQEP